MSKITLASLANLENETTAVNAINSNSAILTTAMDNTLSRDGTSPNQMGAPLDMNSWPIINLPAPGSANSPARLVDVTSTNPINISLSLSGDATAPASSGVLTTTVAKVNGVTYPASPSTNTVPVVTGTNTVAYQQIGTAQIATGAVTSASIANNTIVAGDVANNAIGNAQLRQSAGLSVVGTTGTLTANVADITGTTRQVLAVNTAGTGLTFAQPQGDQLKGTTTNDVAAGGNVGEYVSSTVAESSPVALTTGAGVNVTSISLTGGDWDIFGQIGFTGGATTTTTSLSAALSTTSGSIGVISISFFNQILASTVLYNGAFNSVSYALPVARLSLSTTTTVFLVARSDFATSTASAWGNIQARRVR